MWKHYCKVENCWLSIGRGQLCNWCNLKEENNA
jgi:hypothetical protein